jgi:hypothetical protein
MFYGEGLVERRGYGRKIRGGVYKENKNKKGELI